MISYYNNSIEIWEPFLESTTLALKIEKDEKTLLAYACFKKPFNLNLTEELVESVMQAWLHLLKS